MLIRAFAQEVIGQVKPEDFRRLLEGELDAKLKSAAGETS
jgi:hypothetical protein